MDSPITTESESEPFASSDNNTDHDESECCQDDEAIISSNEAIKSTAINVICERNEEIPRIIPKCAPHKLLIFGPNVAGFHTYVLSQLDKLRTAAQSQTLIDSIKTRTIQAENANQPEIRARLYLDEAQVHYRIKRWKDVLCMSNEASDLIGLIEDEHARFRLQLVAHRMRYASYGKLGKYESAELEIAELNDMLWQRHDYRERHFTYYVQASNIFLRLRGILRPDTREKLIIEGIRLNKMCGDCIVNGSLIASKLSNYGYIGKMAMLHLDMPYVKHSRYTCISLQWYLAAQDIIMNKMCGFSTAQMDLRFKLRFLLLLGSLHFRAAQLDLLSRLHRDKRNRHILTACDELYDASSYLGYASYLSKDCQYTVKDHVNDFLRFVLDPSPEGAHAQMYKLSKTLKLDKINSILHVPKSFILGRSGTPGLFDNMWTTALIDCLCGESKGDKGTKPGHIFDVKIIENKIYNYLLNGVIMSQEQVFKLVCDHYCLASDKRVQTEITGDKCLCKQFWNIFVSDLTPNTFYHICTGLITFAKICLKFPELKTYRDKCNIDINILCDAQKALTYVKMLLFKVTADSILNTELLLASSGFYLRCAQALVMKSNETKGKSAFQFALLHAEMADSCSTQHKLYRYKNEHLTSYISFLRNIDKTSETQKGLCETLRDLSSASKNSK